MTAVAALAAFVIPLLFPVYFRLDDASYLAWAASHPNPLDAFLATSYGLYRPIPLLVFWCLHALFGLDAYPYQVATTFLYGLSLVLLFRAAGAMFSRSVALWSLVVHLAAFAGLLQLAFWFSNLNTLLELCLINLALVLLARAARGGRALGGALAYIAAILCREPSIAIVPLVHLAWVVRSDAEHRGRGVRAALFLLGIGALWILLVPYAAARQVLLDAADPLDFVVRRWSFYAKELRGGGGLLLWTAGFLSALRPLRPALRLPAALGLTAAAAALPPALALGLLVVAFLPGAARGPALPALIWACVPLAGLLTVDLMVRAYLAEAALGFALLAGLGLHGFARDARLSLESPALRAVAVVAVLAGAAFVAARKLPLLRAVSAARQNHREAMEYVRERCIAGRWHLVLVEYEDRGLDYRRDVLTLPDAKKAREQKTMELEHVRDFLRAAGRTNVRVHSHAWLEAQGRAPPRTLVLAMNGTELAFLRASGRRFRVVHESRRSGQGAWLLAPVR